MPRFTPFPTANQVPVRYPAQGGLCSSRKHAPCRGHPTTSCPQQLKGYRKDPGHTSNMWSHVMPTLSPPLRGRSLKLPNSLSIGSPSIEQKINSDLAELLSIRNFGLVRLRCHGDSLLHCPAQQHLKTRHWHGLEPLLPLCFDVVVYDALHFENKSKLSQKSSHGHASFHHKRTSHSTLYL